MDATLAKRRATFAVAALGLSVALGALAGSSVGTASGAIQSAHSAPDSATDGLLGYSSYEHVDTWDDVDWELKPGNIALPYDISTTPDGTIYVTDAGNRGIHVFEPTGSPRSVFTPSRRGVYPRVDGG